MKSGLDDFLSKKDCLFRRRSADAGLLGVLEGDFDGVFKGKMEDYPSFFLMVFRKLLFWVFIFLQERSTSLKGDRLLLGDPKDLLQKKC